MRRTPKSTHSSLTASVFLNKLSDFFLGGAVFSLVRNTVIQNIVHKAI